MTHSKELIAQTILDIEKEVDQIFSWIESNPQSLKHDKVLNKYLDEMLNLIEKYESIK